MGRWIVPIFTLLWAGMHVALALLMARYLAGHGEGIDASKVSSQFGVTNFKGGSPLMAPWGAVIPENDRWAVVAFLRTLLKGAPEVSSSQPQE